MMEDLRIHPTPTMPPMTPTPTMPPTTPVPTRDALDYLANHLWIPVLGGFLFIITVAFTVYCICKRWRSVSSCGNRGYTHINSEDLMSSVKIEASRIKKQDEIRDAALLQCSFYLRNTGSYSLIDHLPDMGSRLGKQWFLVMDGRARGERLLTQVKKSPQMNLPFTTTTQRTLLDLFLIMKHPYIQPVSHIDFVRDHDLVVIITPFCRKGSLKDLLYSCQCTEPWQQKYYMKKKGLPLPLVKLYGKQILQALLYLSSKGFPPHQHLHNGNVLVDGNTCRLTGYESSMLGLQSKMFPLLRKKVKDNRDPAIDTLCFGHMLYELAAGGELTTATPDPRQLLALVDTHSSLVPLMEFIFDPTAGGYPSIEQISSHAFFQNVVLEEMAKFNPSPIHFTKDIKQLLKSVVHVKPERTKSRPAEIRCIIQSPAKSSSDRPAKVSKKSKRKSVGPSGAASPPLVELGSLGHQGYHQFTEDFNGVDPHTKPVAGGAAPAGGSRTALLSQIKQGRTLHHVKS